MPFCKRTILPKDVCKPDGGRLLELHPQPQQQQRQRRRQQAEVFGDLADVCGFTLCSVLRQLSDLSRHSVSILEELEGELVSICHRSGALEGRVVRLQRHVADLISKPPPRSKRGLKSSAQFTWSHFTQLGGAGGRAGVKSVSNFGRSAREICGFVCDRVRSRLI